MTQEDFDSLYTRILNALLANSKMATDLRVVNSPAGVNLLPGMLGGELVALKAESLQGESGKTPALTFIVNTLPYGSDPTVDKTGAVDNPVITIGLPTGKNGEKIVPVRLATGIGFRYESETDAAVRLMFTFAEIMPDVSDFSPAGIAILQQPASDYVEKIAKPAMAQISQEVSQLKQEITEDAELINTTLTNQVNVLKGQAETVIQETIVAKTATEVATVNAQSVSDHPGYIGSDYHVYTWDYVTKAYRKTDTVLRPEGFSVYRIYTSIALMNADLANVPEGKFVLINTNNVEQADNAKLYVRGATAFEYLVDMSGAIGFTGKTPGFSIGTVTKGDTPSAIISENGVDSNGNPLYKINLVLPKGDQGKNGTTPVIEIGTTTTGEPGTSASATLTSNGQTPEGNPKYILSLTIPRGSQGLPGTGSGNVTATAAGLVSGKKYLFVPGANSSTVGTFVEYVAPTISEQVQPDWNAMSGKGAILNKPTIPAKNSQLTNDSNFATESVVDGKITAHNTSGSAHADIRQKLSDVEAIARGKSRAKVFDTVAALDTWLAVAANKATLEIGDNLYIKATNVPDYWWDGTAKQPIEAEKVDLTEYLKKTEAEGIYQKKVAGKDLSTNDYTTAEKNKLSGIAANANNYVHPSYTSRSSGLYKVTVDATGHISSVTAATKADITGLGIPAQDTTYNPATTNAAGLMSAGDKIVLDRQESYTTASTVASLDADYRYIYVTLSANASLSVNVTGVAYNGRSITAYVYCSSARTIAIPTTGSYVSMCGSSYTCPAGKWVEFNLECIAGIWHIAKLEQE